jgi:hypothetical protein
LGFRYEPTAYYQGLPRVWTKEARNKGFGFSSGWDLPQSGKCGFGHLERKTKKKIGITVHVGAPMDLIVLRSAGFRGCVAWRKPRPSTSRP